MNEQSRATPTPVKRREATVDEMFQIGDLLTAHCRKADNGMAEFEPGWTDERVSEEIGCPKASVIRVRKARVGQIRTISASKARLETIERELAGVKASIGNIVSGQRDLNDRLKRLETRFASLKA